MPTRHLPEIVEMINTGRAYELTGDDLWCAVVNAREAVDLIHLTTLFDLPERVYGILVGDRDPQIRAYMLDHPQVRDIDLLRGLCDTSPKVQAVAQRQAARRENPALLLAASLWRNGRRWPHIDALTEELTALGMEVQAP